MSGDRILTQSARLRARSHGNRQLASSGHIIICSLYARVASPITKIYVYCCLPRLVASRVNIPINVLANVKVVKFDFDTDIGTQSDGGA